MIFLKINKLEKIISKKNQCLYPWHNKNYLNNFFKNSFPVNDHWKSLVAQKKHIRYTFNLYRKFLNEFSQELNRIHQVKYDKRYWEILIGPWLWWVLDNSNERFSYIKYFFENNKKTFFLNKYNFNNNQLFPKSTEQISDYYFSDEWNFYYSYRIINTFFPHKVILKKKNNNSVEKKIINFQKKNNAKIINYQSEPFYFLKKITSIHLVFCHVFSFKNLIKYFLINKFLFFNKNKKIANLLLIDNVNLETRKSILLKKGNNKYENFLCEFLKEQIPMSFIENYSSIIQQISSLPRNINKVLCTQELYFDTISMFYVAEIVAKNNKKSKLHYFQHGSEYGLSNYNFNEKHEISICDFYHTWGWKNNKLKKILPSGNYKRTPYKCNIFNLSKKKDILVIVRSSQKYFRSGSSNIGLTNWLTYLQDCLNIPKYISSNQYRNLVIRMHKASRYWYHKYFFSTKYKNLIIDDGNMDISKLLKSTKFVICTYFSSLFFELINSDVPIFLIYNLKNNIVSRNAINDLRELKKNNILFEDSKSLVNFINNNSIQHWFLDEKTQKARKNFYKKYYVKTAFNNNI